MCKLNLQMNITRPRITTLGPREVFVFGSNLAGRHGAGAALMAWRDFGMPPGWEQGRYRQCYAIPTKDHKLRVRPLEHIALSVDTFTMHAAENPEDNFSVTAIGCGLAGYSPKEIAPLFRAASRLPNVSLPQEFWEVLNEKES